MTKQQKNILLLVTVFVTLYICYLLAISKTLEQKKQYDSLSKEILLSQNAPKSLSLLKQKEVYYDSLLTKYQLGGSSIQNNLLKVINYYAEAHDIKVVSFLEPHTITKNDLVIKTYEFVLEGNYNDINQLTYQLEQKTKFGEIINLNLKKLKNYRTGKSYLQANVLLKSFG